LGHLFAERFNMPGWRKADANDPAELQQLSGCGH
jgi:hypothetical protein